MPQATPYAKVLASVNGGAATPGGQVVPGSATIVLSAQSTIGWPVSPAPKWEIYGFFQSTFPLPSGWTDDGAGTYYYLGLNPPSFALPSALLGWGKFLFRLTIGGGLKAGQLSADMVDTTAALSVLSPSGQNDVAFQEGAQFSTARTWVGGLQSNLRTIEAGIGASATVASFGAKGDGVTNDTAAFVAAIAALPTGGTLVLVPGATYLITSLHITKGVTLYCTGRATIKTVTQPSAISGFAAMILVDNGSGGNITTPFSMSGVELNYATTWTGGTVGSEAPDVQALFIRSDSQVLLRNVDLHDAPRAGLYLLGTTNDITLDNVRSHNNGYAGVVSVGQSITCRGGDYRDNSIGARTWNALDGYGITGHNQFITLTGVHVEGNRSQQIDAHSYTGQFIASGITYKANGNEVIGFAIALNDVVGTTVISDCVLEGGAGFVQGAIAVVGDPTAATGMTHITIDNVVIKNFASWNAGINISAMDTDSIAIRGVTIDACPTGDAIFIEPGNGGTIGNCPRCIPRTVLLDDIAIIDSGAIRINAAQELFLGNVSFSWSDAAHTPLPSAFAIGAGAARRGYIGRVHFTGEHRFAMPSTVTQYSSPGFAGGLFLNAAPAAFSWGVGDKSPRVSPRPGAANSDVCIWPGAADAVASTTGTSTIATNRIDRIASIANILAGDFITLTGETFDTDEIVEVLRVDGAMLAVDTASSTTITAHTSWEQMVPRIAVNDWIAIAGVTFGAAQFAHVTAVNTTAHTITVAVAADQTVSNATLSVNRAYVKGTATVGVAAAALAFPRATFRELGIGATQSSLGELSSSDKMAIDNVPRASRRVVTVTAGTGGNLTQTGNGTPQVFSIGDPLPANARVVGHELRIATGLSGGGLTTAAGTIGGTVANGIVSAVDLMTATNTAGTAGVNPRGSFGGQQLTLTITPDAGHQLSSVTAGSIVAEVDYIQHSPALWLPTETAGCTLWIPTDDFSAVTLDSAGFLSGFTDRSSAAFALTTSGTGSTHPRHFRQTPANGRPGILFDGIDDALIGPAISAILNADGSYTAYLVVTPVKARTANVVYNNEPICADANGFFGVVLESTPIIATYAADPTVKSQSVAMTLGAPVIITARHTAGGGGSLFIEKNSLGESAGTASGVISTLTGLLLFGQYSTFHANYYLHEAIFYNRSQSATERAERQLSLKGKWGIA